MHLDTRARQMMLKQMVIEHKFIETVSVQRGDGARSDRGVRKETNSVMKILDREGEKKGRQHQAKKQKKNKKTCSRGIRLTVTGVFFVFILYKK